MLRTYFSVLLIFCVKLYYLFGFNIIIVGGNKIMAKFIVIDGLDGCGKATQTELLKQALEKMGKKVVKITFPKYDSDSSAPVRMYLGGELGNDPELLNPYMCGSFYAVDRFIQYVTDWKNTLMKMIIQ